MKMNFKRELELAGWANDTDEFYRHVNRLFAEMFPHWTDEQLKRHPVKALDFCDTVRAHTGTSQLTDPLILGALENARKRRIRPEMPAIDVPQPVALPVLPAMDTEEKRIAAIEQMISEGRVPPHVAALLAQEAAERCPANQDPSVDVYHHSPT